MRNELQAAVRYFEMLWEGKTDFEALAMCDRREMERTALSALRDALSRLDGCEMCRGTRFVDMSVVTDNYNKCGKMIAWEEYKPSFCPMCGRKLEEDDHD